MYTRRARSGILVACTLLVSSVLGLAGTAVAASDASQEPRPAPTPTPAPTQTTTYDTVPDDFSLTVSPTRLVIGPDEANEGHEILVVNRGQDPMHVDVQVQSFVGGRDGSMVLQDDAPYSASEWVAIEPASFDLQPGTAQNVTVSVAIPQSPDSGDHQVALVFLVPAGETASNIKINRGVATPVYITVPGRTDDSAEVGDLVAPAFATSGPVTVSAEVHNIGTVHRDFRGDTALAIIGSRGTTFPDFTVPRGGDRSISAQWQPPFMCVCDLSVAIANADGMSVTKVVRVVVFPVVPALIVLGLLLAAVLVLLVRHRYRKGTAQADAEVRASTGSGDG